MGHIVTNVQTAPVVGLWHRMATLQSGGTDVASGDLLGEMGKLSIPRDQRAVVHAVTTWAASGISAEEGFALWLLRQRQDQDGGYRRRPESHTAETNPTIRYAELALGVGETPESDDHLQRALSWLETHIRVAGGLSDFPEGLESEVGTTGRALNVMGAAGALDEETDRRLTDFLLQTADHTPSGMAWRTQPSTPTPVTGATALAVRALVSTSREPEAIREGCRWLLSVQNKDGGWVESPLRDGSNSSVPSNTFNVVRTLLCTSECSVVDGPGVSSAIDRARRWCRAQLPRSRRRVPHDAAFMLRVAVALGLGADEHTLALVDHLREHARREWTTKCDLYVDVELVALALQEWRRDMQSRGTAVPFVLPAVPPPFLRRQAHVYDLLYRLATKSSWTHIVDRIASVGLAEAAIGAVLGTIAALAVLDDRVLTPLAVPEGARSIFAVTMLVIGLALWLLVRTTVRRSRRIALASLACDVVAASSLTAWTVYAYEPASALGVALVLAANFLVIDVVAYSADQSGVIAHLLPEG